MQTMLDFHGEILLEIVFRPWDSRPVTVVMMNNWLSTGEVILSPGTASDLEELIEVWDFARNDIADQLLERLKKANAEMKLREESDSENESLSSGKGEAQL